MNLSDKSYKKYFIKGFILLAIGLLIISFGFVFPFIIKDNDYIIWISIGIILIGIIILIPSFYLLKEGNDLRLNYLLDNKTNEKNLKRK